MDTLKLLNEVVNDLEKDKYKLLLTAQREEWTFSKFVSGLKDICRKQDAVILAMRSLSRCSDIQ